MRDLVSATLVRSSPGLIAALIFIKHGPTGWTVKGVCALHALYIKCVKTESVPARLAHKTIKFLITSGFEGISMPEFIRLHILNMGSLLHVTGT